MRLADTAGVRDTEDDIEMEGIRRALEHVADAQMRLVVVDVTTPARILVDILAKLEQKPDVIVLNKADLMSAEIIQQVEGMAPVFFLFFSSY